MYKPNTIVEKIRRGFSLVLPRKQTNDGETVEAGIAETAYSFVRFAKDAYKNPNDVHAYGLPLSLTKVGGPPRIETVCYFSDEVARAAFDGFFEIYLGSVWDADRNGFFSLAQLPSPYVTFSVGSSMFRSVTRWNTKKAYWNHTFYLPLRKEDLIGKFDGYMYVSIYDNNNNGPPLVSGAWDVNWLKQNALIYKGSLSNNGIYTQGGRGIDFTIKYLSFENAWNTGRPYGIHNLSRVDGSSVVKPQVFNGVSWKYGTEKMNMQRIAFIDIEPINTQAWLWKDIDPNNKLLIVSFRGTDPRQVQDIVSNIRVGSSNLSPICGNYDKLTIANDIVDNDILVHQGYLECYCSIRETLLQLVYGITGWSKDWSIVFTGHSLGGALATLAAFEFASRRTPTNDYLNVSVITFAAVRVGVPKFVRLYNATVPNSIRVVCHKDVFPLIPPHLEQTAGEVTFDRFTNQFFVTEDPQQSTNSHTSIVNQPVTLTDRIVEALNSVTTTINIASLEFGRIPLVCDIFLHLPKYYVQTITERVRPSFS